MEDNLFNFILTLYVGFFILYMIHPEPKILYKRVFLQSCLKENAEMCLD